MSILRAPRARALVAHRARILAAPVLLTLGGCRTSPMAPQVDAAGTYALRTVNGALPPAVIARTSQRTVELLEATLTVRTDHQFVLRDRVRISEGTGAMERADSSAGSWVSAGSQITFTPATAGLLAVTTVTQQGSTLTLVDDGGSVPVRIVFSR